MISTVRRILHNLIISLKIKAVTFSKGRKGLVTIIVCTSIAYLLVIAFNISPYLRGPAPYPPEWRWGYQFSNTFGKLWAPLSVAIVLLIFAYYLETCSHAVIRKYKTYLLGMLLLIFFLFQVSLVYYSRSGIHVLFSKIAVPGYNGNYTVALQITDVKSFITNYEKNLAHYPLHASVHPPGTALFSYAVNQSFLLFPQLKPTASMFQPKRADMQAVWNQLRWNEKLGALSLGFLISILSLLALFPLYALGNTLGGERVGMRAAFLYGVIPSVSLFIPLPDAMYAVFSIVATCLFVIAQKKDSSLLFFLAGLTLALGMFFSLSVLPIILFLFLFALFTYLANRQRTFFSHMIFYAAGIIIFPILLFFFFGYNTLSASAMMMKIMAPRSYLLWVFFNLYDFFMFAGVPVSILFIVLIKQQLMSLVKKTIRSTNMFALSFIATLLLVDISGSSKGEVARIWLPFVPIVAILEALFLTTNLKLGRKQFLIVLMLQIVQVVVFQTFLVLYP